MRRGLAPSRERARALIMAGQVFLGEKMLDKPGTLVSLDANCRLAEKPDELKYVSRGGLKLEKALQEFDLKPAGLIALDVGASTGGFTDCLLRNGASKVYALDVGRAQLAWTLRNDPRVVVMEHTNIRHVTALPEPIQCVVIDVSFISLRLVLPPIVSLLVPDGWIVGRLSLRLRSAQARIIRDDRLIAFLQARLAQREQIRADRTARLRQLIHRRDHNFIPDVVYEVYTIEIESLRTFLAQQADGTEAIQARLQLTQENRRQDQEIVFRAYDEIHERQVVQEY